MAPIRFNILEKSFDRLSFPSKAHTSTKAVHLANRFDCGIRSIKLPGDPIHALLCGLTRAGDLGDVELKSSFIKCLNLSKNSYIDSFLLQSINRLDIPSKGHILHNACTIL